MRFEPAGADGSLQCTDVDAEFLGQLHERQQLSLLRVMRDHRASPHENWRRRGAEPTVPHAKRVHPHVQELGEISCPAKTVCPRSFALSGAGRSLVQCPEVVH